MLRRMRSWTVALCLGLLACSSDDDPAPPASTATSVTKRVGAEGGTVEVGGATLTIPAGALASPVDIRIDVNEGGPPPGFVAASKVFRCEPIGTTFLVPATMRMPFVGEPQDLRMFWSSGADPSFKDLGGRAESGFMTASVSHFSSGFVGRPE